MPIHSPIDCFFTEHEQIKRIIQKEMENMKKQAMEQEGLNNSNSEDFIDVMRMIEQELVTELHVCKREGEEREGRTEGRKEKRVVRNMERQYVHAFLLVCFACLCVYAHVQV